MKICVLGDSHSKVFNYCNSIQKTVTFHVKAVGGATAQGCVNPNSTTDALKIFKEHIMSSHKYDKVMIMLGEVDCGYLIWVRSKKYKLSVEEQIGLCVKNIGDFITSILLTRGYKSEDVIICGVHLPAIRDNTDPTYLSGARKEVDVSQYERTLKTLQYNNLLKEIARLNRYTYIDITKSIIGDDGLIKSCYLSNEVGDHHLQNEKIGELWYREINSVCTGSSAPYTVLL